jgi:hypothetical protein
MSVYASFQSFALATKHRFGVLSHKINHGIFRASQYGYKNYSAFGEAIYQIWFGIATTIAGLISLALFTGMYILRFFIQLLSAKSLTDLKNKAIGYFRVKSLYPFAFILYQIYAGLVNLSQFVLIPSRLFLSLINRIMLKVHKPTFDNEDEPPALGGLVFPLWKGASSLEEHFNHCIRSLISDHHNVDSIFSSDDDMRKSNPFSEFISSIKDDFKKSFSSSELKKYVSPYQYAHQFKEDFFDFLIGLRGMLVSVLIMTELLFTMPVKVISFFFTCHTWKTLGDELARYFYNLADLLLRNAVLGLVGFSKLRHLILIPIRGIVTAFSACFSSHDKNAATDDKKNDGLNEANDAPIDSGPSQALSPNVAPEIPNSPVVVYASPGRSDPDNPPEDDFVGSILNGTVDSSVSAFMQRTSRGM